MHSKFEFSPHFGREPAWAYSRLQHIIYGFLPGIDLMIQNSPTLQPTQVRTRKRSTTDLILLLVLLSDVAFNWLYVQVLQAPLEALYLASETAMHPLASLSLLKLPFIVVGVLFWIGRLRPIQVGFRRHYFQSALTAIFGTWCLLQLVQVGTYLGQGIPMLSSLDWGGRNPLFLFGGFLSFLMTKALFDEIVYRSVLLPHTLKRVRRFLALPFPVLLASAVAVSQTLYVLVQVSLFPILGEESFFASLTWVVMVALMNAFVFIRTENIFLTAGLHALWFFPFLVLPQITAFRPTLFICGLLIGIFWPMMQREVGVSRIQR